MPMPPRLRKIALTGHVTFSVGWLGAAVAYLSVAVAALNLDDPAFARGAYPALAVVGWFVLVPLSLAALASGVVQAVGTKWGLLRHYWIVAKLALTVVGTLILLGHMPAVSRVADLVQKAPTTGADLGHSSIQLIVHASAGSLLLLVVTALSILKPWGRTPLGRRRDDAGLASSTPPSRP